MSNNNEKSCTTYGTIADGVDHALQRFSAANESKANTPKDKNVRCTECKTIMRSAQEGDFCPNLICNMHGKVQQRLFTN